MASLLPFFSLHVPASKCHDWPPEGPFTGITCRRHGDAGYRRACVKQQQYHQTGALIDILLIRLALAFISASPDNGHQRQLADFAGGAHDIDGNLLAHFVPSALLASVDLRPCWGWDPQ